MLLETKLKTLEQEKNELEDLLKFQNTRISSKFEPKLEQDFWQDRQSRLINMIIRATKPICIYFFIFMSLSLVINFLNADPAYRYHDMSRNVFSFCASWIALITTFVVARRAKWHKYFTVIVALMVFFALVVNFSVQLSMQSIPLAWRGTIITTLGIVFIYICSGLRPRDIFISSMFASICSYLYLKYSYTYVPVWVIVNTLLVSNLVGLSLSILSVSNERIRFLQALIIEYDKKIYSALNVNLTDISQHDSLTNLRNRRGFEALIKNLMQKAKIKEDQFALLFIDVDYFKLYNDNYGHDAGDKALIEVARILTKNIRKNEIAMRFGGEEFIVILENISKVQAEKVAQRIIDDILKSQIQHEYSSISPYLTVSIGITMYAGEETTFTQILKAADQALYIAKKNGRNQYHVSHTTDLEI